MSYQSKKERRNKWDSDPESITPRLNELIRLARWLFYIGIAIVLILGASFIQAMAQGMIGK